MTADNPYLAQVHATLPRVLALFDADPTSSLYGVGDRTFWAWKLIDFGNATFQGAAHGIARLHASELLPAELPAASALDRVDAIVRGTRAVTSRNGSVCEAFPNEASFCVTALVAFDLLCAIDLLDGSVPASRRDEWREIVAPLIGFLLRSDEHHALISNHLATAAAALYRWHRLTGERSDRRGRFLLQRILDRQSEEGWFVEYEGADPGYQTLATYYLADLHLREPELGLSEPLVRSVRFLWNFAHPDGSFGGIYGSRNTRVYYPAGIEALAAGIPEAAALAAFMRDAIRGRRTVTLDTIDAPNLVPSLNAYCWAAALRAGTPEAGEGARPHPVVPCLDTTGPTVRRFPEAGLVTLRHPDHYTVVSTHKGGALQHYPRAGRPRVDAGVVAAERSGRRLHTQAWAEENEVTLDEEVLTVTARLAVLDRPVQTPFKFFVLRFLALTVMRSVRMGNLVKRTLVRFLITGTRFARLSNRRTVRFAPEFTVTDEWVGDAGGVERIELAAPFSAIHMASQGYWQRGDDAV